MYIFSFESSFLQQAKCRRVDPFFYRISERFSSGLSSRQLLRSSLLLSAIMLVIGLVSTTGCLFRLDISVIINLRFNSSNHQHSKIVTVQLSTKIVLKSYKQLQHLPDLYYLDSFISWFLLKSGPSSYINSFQQSHIIRMEPCIMRMEPLTPLAIPYLIQVVNEVNQQKDVNNILYSMLVQSVEMLEAIPYLQEHQCINNSVNQKHLGKGPQVITIGCSIISPNSLEIIKNILPALDYQIKKPPKVSSTNAREVVGPQIHDFLKKLNSAKLKDLYKATQYLKMVNLRLHVVSMIAASVFVGPTFQDLDNRRKDLNIEKPYSYMEIRKIKQEFEEINMII